MALATTATGFYVGSCAWPNAFLLFKTLLGAALLGAGASALNQFFERQIDARMKRTKNRPLPSGRLKAKAGLIFGILVSTLGIACLWVGVNTASGFIGLWTFGSYVFIYTPLKRKTTWNTLVGAVPGALPILIGYTAAGRPLDQKAWVLFLILFLWQLPHFFAIAWVHKEDYQKSGFRMLCVEDNGGQRSARQIVFCTGLLFAASLAPTLVGMAGLTYLFLAIFFGFLFMGFSWYLANSHLSDAKKFVTASILYLLILNVSMILDKV